MTFFLVIPYFIPNVLQFLAPDVSRTGSEERQVYIMQLKAHFNAWFHQTETKRLVLSWKTAPKASITRNISSERKLSV